MVQTAKVIPSRWHGILDITYQRQRNATQPTQVYTQAPYKLQRPFYPQGKDICYTTIFHTAGGMVGSDRLSQKISLKAHTHAVITTTAASKIYRSNGFTASQTVNVEVGENACLEYLPRETILFNGAQYQQQLTVNLASNATWLGWEIIRCGRSARGEQFLQGDWRSGTEVWQNGQLIWVDRPWLPAGTQVLNSPHDLGGYPLIATLVWLGKPVPPEIIKAVRNLWSENTTTGEAGSSALISGLLCRYRGNSRAEVIDWFIKIWRLLRQWDGKKTPVTPRVWQV